MTKRRRDTEASDRVNSYEVSQLKRAQKIAKEMFKRKIWGGRFEVYPSTLLDFLRLFADTELWTLVAFLRNIQRKDLVLDFGCGVGNDSLQLAYRLGCSVIGVDLSRCAVEAAKNALETAPAHLQKRCTFIVADGRYLPLKAQCFDGVFSRNVFGHLPKLEKAILEISRVLKWRSVGSFFMETTGLTKFRIQVIELLGYNPWNKFHGHISLFTFKQLKEMLKRGEFVVQKRKFVPGFLDLLISRGWSGGGGFGWLEARVPKLRQHFKFRRLVGNILEMIYATPLLYPFAYLFRTALYNLFLNISSLDTGGVFIKVKKAKSFLARKNMAIDPG